MKTPDEREISASIGAWASALGKDPKTIQLRLKKREYRFEPHDKIPAQEIFKALMSDKDEALARIAAADADAKERENRVADGELMELPTIEKALWFDLLAPLRLELEQLPQIYAGLCNPQDPQTAEKVLRQFVEKLKVNLKEPKNEDALAG